MDKKNGGKFDFSILKAKDIIVKKNDLNSIDPLKYGIIINEKSFLKTDGKTYFIQNNQGQWIKSENPPENIKEILNNEYTKLVSPDIMVKTSAVPESASYKLSDLSNMFGKQTQTPNPIADVTQVVVEKILNSLTDKYAKINNELLITDEKMLVVGSDFTDSILLFFQNNYNITIDRNIFAENLDIYLNELAKSVKKSDDTILTIMDDISKEPVQPVQPVPGFSTELVVSSPINKVTKGDIYKNVVKNPLNILLALALSIISDISPENKNIISEKQSEIIQKISENQSIIEQGNNVLETLNKDIQLNLQLKELEKEVHKINVKFSLYSDKNALYIDTINVSIQKTKDEVPVDTALISKDILNNSSTDVNMKTIDSLIVEKITAIPENIDDFKKLYETNNDKTSKKSLENSNSIFIDYNLFLTGIKQLYVNFNGINYSTIQSISNVNLINKTNSLQVINSNLVVTPVELYNDSFNNKLKDAYENTGNNIEPSLKKKMTPEERRAAQKLRETPSIEGQQILEKINQKNQSTSSMNEIDGGKRKTKKRVLKTKRRNSKKGGKTNKRKYNKSRR